MVTLSQVRAIFRENREFVFELTANGIDRICLNNPIGWDEVTISYVRNRSNIGLFRSFITELSFVKEDREYIESIIATHNFEANITLTIYELNGYTMTYDTIYVGTLDLAKYSISDYKMKMPVVDNDLANYIEKSGDVDYSLTITDMVVVQPIEPRFLGHRTNFLYSGIGLNERGVANFSGGYVTIPEATSVTNVAYFKPAFSYILRDVDTGLMTDTQQEYLLPYGGNSWSGGDQSFFTADIVGGVCTVNYDVRFNFNWLNSLGITALKVGITYTGLPNFIDPSFPSSMVIFFDNSLPGNYRPAYLAYSGSKTFTLPANATVRFLVAVDRRADQNLYCAEFQYTSIVNNLSVVYKGTPTTRNIQFCPLHALTKAVLYKMTEKKYFKIIGLDDYRNIIIVNGNQLRGLRNKVDKTSYYVSDFFFNATFNDLVEFCKKVLGLGYEIQGDTIIFKKQYDFFNLGAVAKKIINPVAFSESAMTDFYYNKITTGYNDYATEYLSGKYDMFGKTEFTTPILSTKNELNLVPKISGNAFEIEEKVRIGIKNDNQLTDFEGDYTNYAIFAKWSASTPPDATYPDGESPIWEMNRDGYDLDNSQLFPYNATIYNLQISPIRSVVRNLWNLHNAIINTEQFVTMARRIKNEQYFSKIGAEPTYYEGSDFYIYPECGEQLRLSVLTDFNKKLEPYLYEFTAPLSGVEWNDLIANKDKLILVEHHGVRFAGFIDDVSKNPVTDEAKNIKIIKANLTQQQIEDLWQIY